MKLFNKLFKKKQTHLLQTIFWVYIVVFIIMVLGAFIGRWLRGNLFLPTITIFFLLGVALVFLTIRDKVKGKLKIFLLLAGASSIGFFVSVLLHNLFYALGIITKNIIILTQLIQVISVIFFIISVFICPIAFLVGIIGSIVMFIRKK